MTAQQSLHRSWRSGLAVALGLLALVPAARADDIVLVPGTSLKVAGGRLTGTIQAESPEKVTIRTAAGATQDVPVDQIASITYSGQPASFTLAETRAAAGNLDEAITQYEAAARQAEGKPFLLQAAQFGAARMAAIQAQAEPSRTTQAIQRLEAFLKAAPSSRFKAAALELIAQLAISANDLARAGQALDQLATIPWAATRSAMLKAKILSQQEKFDEALAAIDQVIASAPKAYPAQLVRSEILAAAGQFAEAEAEARKVIAAVPPEDAQILAPAYNTLGDCLQAAKQPKAALFAYLHTDILYDANKQEHARALAQIAQTWRALEQPERADEALARLNRLYPNSPLARAARPQPSAEAPPNRP